MNPIWQNAVKASALPWYLVGGAPLPVAAYQPKGAASLSASYVNLANPGINDATVATGTPNWSVALGWIGNNFALSTGYTPINTDITIIIRYANSGGGARAFVGTVSGISTYIYANVSGQIRYNNQGNVFVTPGLVTGVLAIAGKNGYRNGVFDGTISAGNAVGTGALWMMAINNSGVILQPETGNLIAIAIYSTALTSPQVAAVSAAMAV
jgi:hypothetical protein